MLEGAKVKVSLGVAAQNLWPAAVRDILSFRLHDNGDVLFGEGPAVKGNDVACCVRGAKVEVTERFVLAAPAVAGVVKAVLFEVADLVVYEIECRG